MVSHLKSINMACEPVCLSVQFLLTSLQFQPYRCPGSLSTLGTVLPQGPFCIDLSFFLEYSSSRYLQDVVPFFLSGFYLNIPFKMRPSLVVLYKIVSSYCHRTSSLLNSLLCFIFLLGMSPHLHIGYFVLCPLISRT